MLQWENRKLRKSDLKANMAAAYFLECYEYAVDQDWIQKPISYALYQTWKLYDRQEQPRGKEDEPTGLQ